MKEKKCDVQRCYTHLSTVIPARIAFATVLNFGFSSLLLLLFEVLVRVKVVASHSLTSSGTAFDELTSERTSSSSRSSLNDVWI